MIGNHDWKEEYIKRQAFWIHDGNPKRPHALLTSGKHSSGFFDSRHLIKEETFLYIMASKLVEVLFKSTDVYLNCVEVVAGPETGATKFALFLSAAINYASNNNLCSWISPKKVVVDGERRMQISDKQQLLYRRVLLCDDVITTGSSLALTEKAIVERNGFVLPFVLALVNRSGEEFVNGKKVVSIISEYMPIWEADECPLCKLGSEAIRPKDNWDKLNGKY